MAPSQRTLDDTARLLLRIMVGGMMLLHGIGKLRHGIDGIEGMISSKWGLPSWFAYGVYVGEVVAPLFVLAGFRARAAAAVLGFNMIVAVLLAHTGDIVALSRGGGWKIELQMFYLLGSVAIMCLGAGRYAASRKHWLD